VAAGEDVPRGWWTVLGFVAALTSLAGQIAVTRIGLGTGETVGEAIARGFRKLPVLLLAILLWIAPFLLIFGGAAVASGATASGTPQLAPGLALVLVPVLLIFLYLVVRLALVTPVASVEPIGPVQVLKRSWALTRGHWGKLFLSLLLVGLVAGILVLAITFGLGSVIVLLAGAPEQGSVSDLLLTFLNQIVGAVFGLVIALLFASFYKQLTGGEAMVSVPDAGHR
jgi:hypothetical protein